MAVSYFSGLLESGSEDSDPESVQLGRRDFMASGWRVKQLSGDRFIREAPAVRFDGPLCQSLDFAFPQAEGPQVFVTPESGQSEESKVSVIPETSRELL